ncbi:MAG TPA: formimidoylglutamate deiminase [Ilumatobacteraceae bacterium]
MTTYWCELAWLGDADGSVVAGVTITVEADRITDVTIDAIAPHDAHVLPGLTLPGMANAHSHAFHRALRGRTHGEAGSFWTWRDRMYDLALRLDPEQYRDLATATFAEMVMAGFTCVGEFHYLHHDRGGARFARPNEMGEVLLEAAAAAGIRITLLDTCYLRAGMTDESQLNEAQLRFSDGDAEEWVARVERMTENSDAKIGAAIHSVRSVDPGSMSVVADWAAEHDKPLHAHVSEQPAENEQCFAVHGCSPVELLARNGVLDDRFSAVHATHLNDVDVALLHKARSTCCLCPTTERDLADGIGPTAAFRDARIAMTIGSDSHAVIDPFEEMRGIELDQRLASLRRGTHQPGELLTAATEAGYRSLGWHDGGRIALGALADLTTVSLTSTRLAGIDPRDAAAAVVFAGTSGDVHHVLVGGRAVVVDGVHATINVADELARSIRDVWS